MKLHGLLVGPPLSQCFHVNSTCSGYKEPASGLCHIFCATVDGYGLVIGFMVHLYTPLGTTVITALSLLSTVHKSLHAKSSPACSVFNSRSLATASNCGDSSAFCAQVLSSQTPLQRSTSVCPITCVTVTTGTCLLSCCPEAGVNITLHLMIVAHQCYNMMSYVYKKAWTKWRFDQ